MEDFSTKLLSFPKRNDRSFTIEQLKHHLVECLELIEKWDEHLLAELVDLMQITKVHLRQNLSPDQIDELTKKRFDKFISKLMLEKKTKKK